MKVYTHPLRNWDKNTYLESYKKHKHLNKKYGFKGTLIFTSSNDIFDPWSLAQWLCEGTNDQPLIALNPSYLHPFTAAWRTLSLTKLYQRAIAINWITGASLSEGKKLGENLAKQTKYARLKEYSQVYHQLLYSSTPLNFNGEYYQLQGAQLAEKCEYQIDYFLAGESTFATNVAMAINANQLVMVNPKNSYPNHVKSLSFGLLIEETDARAVAAANSLFEKTAVSKRTLDFAALNTDSIWKNRLISEVGDEVKQGYTANSLLKFGETPFIVGSVEFIKQYISKLKLKGIDNLIVTLARERDYEMFSSILTQCL
ncbi:MAG: LLM class flavin-dependent oxidoreductase [Bacteroidia bacterium]